MISIDLYWSNICILHRQELIFLDQIKKALLQQNICLNITCFGLGYGIHMSEYMLAHPEEPLPDLFVSTDLETYEDSRIFQRFSESLLPIGDWIEEKQTEDVPKLNRGRFLLPYVAIPLVFYGANHELADGTPAFLDLVDENHPVTFGGIDNSAAKTVAKLIWEAKGPQAACRFLKSNVVTDMPIQAFQRVRTGQSSLALVPSVYALRADGYKLIAACPADGAVAVPSYICVRDSVPPEAAHAVIDALFAPEIMDFYRKNGNLISCNAGTPAEEWLAAHGARLQIPSWRFLKNLPSEKFSRLYRESIHME